jgi:hypothetical protein
VAKAAMESGVATRPIADLDAYRQKLSQYVYKSNLFMKPVFAQAKNSRSASSMPKVRTSVCCAPCRIVVDKAWPSRS